MEGRVRRRRGRRKMWGGEELGERMIEERRKDGDVGQKKEKSMRNEEVGVVWWCPNFYSSLTQLCLYELSWSYFFQFCTLHRI